MGGKAVLMVNKTFKRYRKKEKSEETPERKGADEDFSYLYKILVQTFGFRLLNKSTARDVTTDRWDHTSTSNPRASQNNGACSCIRCVIKTTDFRSIQYFAFAISSHGNINEKDELCVEMSDGVLLPVQSIIDVLAKIPEDVVKIMIINACRGVYSLCFSSICHMFLGDRALAFCYFSYIPGA